MCAQEMAIMLNEFSDFSDDFSIEEIEDIEALDETSKWYVIGAGTFVVVGICAC